MTTQLEDALRTLERLITELEQPLADEDRRGGWTEKSRRSWHAHFVQLRAGLANGARPDGDQYHLMRRLNFDGIGTGRLAAAADALQHQLWDLFADDQARRDRTDGGTTGSTTRRILRALGMTTKRHSRR